MKIKLHSISYTAFPRHRVGVVAGVMVVVLSVCWGPSASSQPTTGPIQDGAPVVLNDGLPRDIRNLTVKQKLGATIPTDVTMVDSDGQELTISSLLDGQLPLILTLNYSNCPMLCNVQLNQLAQSLEKADVKIGRDFRMLSLSIDPTESDQKRAETKTLYIEQVPSHPQAETGWAFCRSDKESIDRLADAVGFPYKYDPASKEYAHPAMAVFISPGGVITRYSLGVAFPPDQMKLAVVEAGQGNVGSVVDQFVLWCYSYDPTAGSYVPQAWKIMKLGGAVTVVLLFLTLLPYWMGRKGSNSNSAPNSPGQANQFPHSASVS